MRTSTGPGATAATDGARRGVHDYVLVVVVVTLGHRQDVYAR